jgi:hypothetical protein
MSWIVKKKTERADKHEDGVFLGLVLTDGEREVVLDGVSGATWHALEVGDEAKFYKGK